MSVKRVVNSLEYLVSGDLCRTDAERYAARELDQGRVGVAHVKILVVTSFQSTTHTVLCFIMVSLHRPDSSRLDPLRFLAGCRKRRLNQVLSVLSLSLGFF